MSLIRKHVAVLQAWACLDLVQLSAQSFPFVVFLSKIPPVSSVNHILWTGVISLRR